MERLSLKFGYRYPSSLMSVSCYCKAINRFYHFSLLSKFHWNSFFGIVLNWLQKSYFQVFRICWYEIFFLKMIYLLILFVSKLHSQGHCIYPFPKCSVYWQSLSFQGKVVPSYFLVKHYFHLEGTDCVINVIFIVI